MKDGKNKVSARKTNEKDGIFPFDFNLKRNQRPLWTRLYIVTHHLTHNKVNEHGKLEEDSVDGQKYTSLNRNTLNLEH